MTINAVDLSEQVIKPTLEYLGMHSLAAEKLLIGTAAQASGFDPFCKRQQGFGIYQIDSIQHRKVWDNYLAFHPELASKIRGLASQHQFLMNPDQELTINLAYTTAIAWAIYLQANLHLPDADDLEGLKDFWRSNFCHSDRSHQQVQQFSRFISGEVAA